MIDYLPEIRTLADEERYGDLVTELTREVESLQSIADAVDDMASAWTPVKVPRDAVTDGILRSAIDVARAAGFDIMLFEWRWNGKQYAYYAADWSEVLLELSAEHRKAMERPELHRTVVATAL